MENKKSIAFPFIIVAIILEVTLYKQFDFEQLKFKHTGLAIVYLIAFAMSLYFIMKGFKNQSPK